MIAGVLWHLNDRLCGGFKQLQMHNIDIDVKEAATVLSPQTVNGATVLVKNQSTGVEIIELANVYDNVEIQSMIVKIVYGFTIGIVVAFTTNQLKMKKHQYRQKRKRRESILVHSQI